LAIRLRSIDADIHQAPAARRRGAVDGAYNRYTSRSGRVSIEFGMAGMIDFVHKRINPRLAPCRHTSATAVWPFVASLRAIHDMMDRVTTLETRRGLDGAATAMNWGQLAAGRLLQRLIGRICC
jgi:hypothetical protein